MERRGAAASEATWTDEKHYDFLNSVEASFVRTVFGDNNDSDNGELVRLDRYLPDTSDSTQDLQTRSFQRRKKQFFSTPTTSSSPSSGRVGSRPISDRRADKRSRKLSLQSTSDDSSHDQVVPQLARIDHEGDSRGPTKPTH